jgi:DNA-binding transcriptional LysR family regulator
MSGQLSRLKLRHYRLISSIAKHGQLSIAADQLAITQPAASRSLAEIERVIGAELFERHPKGMRPTPVGEVVARHAGILLSGLEQAGDEFTAFRDGLSGTVRVGAVTGAAVGFLVPAIRELKRTSDFVDIKVEVAPSVDLMEGLLSGEFDFVLCRIPPGTDADQLDMLRGRAEHLSLLVRAGHPLLRRPRLDLDALGGCTWIVQQHGMPIREAIEQKHLVAGLRPPKDVIESSSLLMTIAYLMASDAVSPVATEVSDLLLNSNAGALATLDMREAIIVSPYHLIRRRRRPISPLAQRLLSLVLERLSARGD